MLFAFALLSAVLTLIDDLAEAVKADALDRCAGFCVTGTVSYVIGFHENLYHLLMEGETSGVDVIGPIKSDPPRPGDRVRLDGSIVPKGADSIMPEFCRIEILGHTAPQDPVKGSAADIMGGRHDFRRALLAGEIRDSAKGSILRRAAGLRTSSSRAGDDFAPRTSQGRRMHHHQMAGPQHAAEAP
jgi:hypothetical protein